MKAALVCCVFGVLVLSAAARTLQGAQQFGNTGNWGNNGNNGHHHHDHDHGSNWNNGGNWNNNQNQWNNNQQWGGNGGFNNNPFGGGTHFNNPCACATACTGTLSRCSLLAGTGTCAPISGLECPSAFTDVLGSIKVCC